MTADIEKEQHQYDGAASRLKSVSWMSWCSNTLALVTLLKVRRKSSVNRLARLLGRWYLYSFIIYALLAIPFKSYLQPLIVMSVIPFGMIGAVVGHWIMGMDLTIMSLLGMLALIGVVVNDSLVLVDFINKKRSEGGELLEAVKMAGASRFRPVMLTSLTTFIGLMPLLFEKATQAQFLIPMAVSLGFGIIFATFITLLLVPVNYLLMERVQGWFK